MVVMVMKGRKTRRRLYDVQERDRIRVIVVG
jgi:hypothetical protein